MRVTKVIAVLALIPAALGAVQSLTRSFPRGDLQTAWPEAVFQAVDWYTLGVLTVLTCAIANRNPIGRGKWVRSIVAHTMGVTAYWLLWGFICISVGWLLSNCLGDGPLTHVTLNRLLVTLPIAILVYSTAAGSFYAYAYSLEARQRESHALRLDAQLSEARLRALRMQLNPHFLFNSLNAVLTLVREGDARTAERTLELLGDVLRQTLRAGARDEIRLDDELAFVRQYLEIEQVRFGDGLTVRWSIDEHARDAIVPEFILQPVVENAIRHGISCRMGAHCIALSATVDGTSLRLAVRDDGPGLVPETQHDGIGLSNTRARLTALYGDAGVLDLRPAVEGIGADAVIRFPFRKMAS